MDWFPFFTSFQKLNMLLEHVELFLAGLQTENFIFCCVIPSARDAGSPASDCEICLTENKIFSFSPRQEKLNMLLMARLAFLRWRLLKLIFQLLQ